MIASDLNNPEFAGATNPDSRLAVQFYSKPVHNAFKSQEAGRPIYEDVDFVRIIVPGDSNNIIDTYARDEHKARFPLQWAHYQNKHAGDAKTIGTPVTAWTLITPAQAEELKALKFFTVEQIANASDSQLQSLGMVAGMSPHAFRDRAIRYLQIATGEAEATKADERIKKLEEENKRIQEEAKEELARMREQMEQVLAAVSQNAQTQPNKPGRKPRAETVTE